MDEGSFTFEIPRQMTNLNVVFLRSRGAEYASHDMQVMFSEGNLDDMKDTFRGWHDELEKKYATQEVMSAGPHFFLKVGEQIADVTIGTNENWIKLRSPGSKRVRFSCPNSNGSCLDIIIDYRDDKDTDTALRIINSVHFK